MTAIRNILWISFEDTSPRFGCYGDNIARTPKVDALAAKGLQYNQALTTAAICAPSRCSIITGMYASSIGCHHMRTSRVSEVFPELPTPYDGVPPAYVKCFTEYLRAAGWFCTNNGKTDYQFGNPASAWDLNQITSEEDQETAHWRQRPDPTQPFFAVFNLGITHESGQWPSYHRAPAVTDPGTVTLPPYLPDTPVTRRCLAQQYDHIADNDRRVGVLLQQLEDDGLADSTAVFIWSDHGEGLPYRKSWPRYAGVQVPLIVCAPGVPADTSCDDIVSLIDLGPTVLSLLGQAIPAHMQGQALLGPQARPHRRYAFATRDRIGESYDHMRTVFDQRYTYIRNYLPTTSRGPMQFYRHKHPTYQELYRLEASQELTSDQRWLFTPRPAEELYDRHQDPHELHNLAADPAQRETLERLRAALTAWQHDSKDMGDIDEVSMVRGWYPAGRQPETTTPMAIPISAEHAGMDHVASNATITASAPLRLLVQSGTQGASTEVRINKGPWRPCDHALNLSAGNYQVEARAIRYGFAPSAISQWAVSVN
ncbi:MAG: sulfatase [Planctomycetota bacterium]|jgi:N-sulfoglucosamine sulfohydrolase|nr:sulfatase [Planctomycetota bacterium]